MLAPGAEAWNPAFDVTPVDLIDGFICEAGVFRTPGDIPGAPVDSGP